MSLRKHLYGLDTDDEYTRAILDFGSGSSLDAVCRATRTTRADYVNQPDCRLAVLILLAVGKKMPDSSANMDHDPDQPAWVKGLKNVGKLSPVDLEALNKDFTNQHPVSHESAQGSTRTQRRMVNFTPLQGAADPNTTRFHDHGGTDAASWRSCILNPRMECVRDNGQHSVHSTDEERRFVLSRGTGTLHLAPPRSDSH